MRLELQEELIFYKMAKIKPNYAALGRQYNCDPRTIKRYLNNPQAGKRQTNKRRPSKLDPYRDVIKDKYKTCSATAIFYFIKELGYEGGILNFTICHKQLLKQPKQLLVLFHFPNLVPSKLIPINNCPSVIIIFLCKAWTKLT